MNPCPWCGGTSTVRRRRDFGPLCNHTIHSTERDSEPPRDDTREASKTVCNGRHNEASE